MQRVHGIPAVMGHKGVPQGEQMSAGTNAGDARAHAGSAWAAWTES